MCRCRLHKFWIHKVTNYDFVVPQLGSWGLLWVTLAADMASERILATSACFCPFSKRALLTNPNQSNTDILLVTCLLYRSFAAEHLARLLLPSAKKLPSSPHLFKIMSYLWSGFVGRMYSYVLLQCVQPQLTPSLSAGFIACR